MKQVESTARVCLRLHRTHGIRFDRHWDRKD